MSNLFSIQTTTLSYTKMLVTVIVILVFTSSCCGRSWQIDGDEDLQLSQYHSLNKRAAFDSACKGYYDREFWGKLSRVCWDCENLFRQPGYQDKCSEGCFVTTDFTQCVKALLLNVEEYRELAELVRG
uniref:Crustacean hyperglycemic hormone like n=1 Tax=Nephrops norvegicus TaxID=6829 RepID=A0A4D6BPZ5_NEPNO|nr:crustacean hyperglycemic hormone like [Nephrops norvegicus]